MRPAMRRGAPVSVDNDLPAGQSAIPIRAADDELARGIDVPDRRPRDPALGQRLSRVGLDEFSDIFGAQLLVQMLCRDYDLRGFDWFAVLVTNSDLALCIGSERPDGARPACFREQLQNAVGIVDWSRHELGGLPAGVAEHKALITGTFVLVPSRIDAGSDIGRLRMKVDSDIGMFPMETYLLIADIADRLPGQLCNVFARDRGRSPRLARDHYAVRGGERLAGDANLVGLPTVAGRQVEVCINDFVGNPVADLVGMPLGDRFAGEQIAAA